MFTDQNGRPLEIEDKVDLTFLINKQKRHVTLQNQEQRYIYQTIWIFVICKKYVQQVREKMLDTATKTGPDAEKATLKIAVHETTETI